MAGKVLTINRTCADFTVGVQHLTTLEAGAYNFICDTIVTHGQDNDPPSLPDDDVLLASVTKMSVRGWRKMKPRLCSGPLAVLVAEDGVISQARVVEEIEKARLRMNAGATGGTASGEARRRKSILLRERLANDRSTIVCDPLMIRSSGIESGDRTDSEPVTSYESRVMKHEEEKESKASRRRSRADAVCFAEDSREMKAANYLLTLIRRNNPEFKQPNLVAWAVDFDAIFRIDARDPVAVRSVMEWAEADQFWMRNCLSPKSLRKHFDKFILEVRNQYGNGNGRSDHRSPGASSIPPQPATPRQRFPARTGADLEREERERALREMPGTAAAGSDDAVRSV